MNSSNLEHSETYSAKKLSLHELASLTSGEDFWHFQSIPSKAIPGYMLTDGPYGLRKTSQKSVDELDSDEQAVPSTCFPPAAAMASSWDPQLAQEVGEAMGQECKQEKVAVILGPAVNIKRNPLGGRSFEYWSEDPLLASHEAAGMIDGIQSQGIGACLKHFAANNQETDRMRISAEVSERALREIYLTAFEYAVKHAKPWTIMCSYNKINGTYSSQNRWLLTDVLRKEWGFRGVVMSDWGAVHDRVAALNAGVNLEMPPTNSDAEIEKAARLLKREVSPEQLRLMAQGILDVTAKVRPAMEEVGYRYDALAHQSVALKAARNSIVLLKNESGILPLAGAGEAPADADGGAGAGATADADAGRAPLGIIGEFARTPRFQGGGSSHLNPLHISTALDELSSRVPGATFAPGFTLDDAEQTDSMRAQALDVARTSRVVVMFLGLPELWESEGFDRSTMALPSKQVALLTQVAAVNPHVVVVLSNGSVVDVASIDNSCEALVESWLGGQESGSAVADVLLGSVNPSGCLAETIPQRIEDNPTFCTWPGGEQKVVYNDDIFVGYRYYDTAKVPVAYPFGHGLSYTTFEYSKLQVEATGPTSAHVKLSVTNTGSRDGAHVVQIYVVPPADGVTPVPRPVHELKAFRKVWLKAGESTSVNFVLRERAFAYWSEENHSWRAVKGTYGIQAARSSRDIVASENVDIAGNVTSASLDENSTIEEWLDDPEAHALMAATIGKDPEEFVPQGRFARKMAVSMPITAAVKFGFISQEDFDTAMAEYKKAHQ